MVSLSAVVIASVGCGKKEEPPAPPPPVSTAPATPAVSTPTTPAAPAPTAVEQVTETATKVAGMITQAKALIAKKDYAAALNLLKELSAQKLTPEQQKLVSDLQATAQKEAASSAVNQAGAEAGKAVGGLLGK
jgi:hypothetical protein